MCFRNKEYGRRKIIPEYSPGTYFFNFQNSKSGIHKMCFEKYVLEILKKNKNWESFLKGVKWSFLRVMDAGSHLLGCREK